MHIVRRWVDVHHVYAADRLYADEIKDEVVRKLWHKWKYGWLGFGGQPLYVEEAQDCDDLARDLVVYIRRKLLKNGVSQPVFYCIDATHAYIAYFCGGRIKVLDPNDGTLCDPQIYHVEMV
jgi:hypothetical protein